MLLVSKMSQDFFYDVLLLNTRDDFDRASTAATDLDVDIEVGSSNATIPKTRGGRHFHTAW
jgi:hypothetical protein